jgi:glycosyltransferase involved in cell wall biosynthesis
MASYNHARFLRRRLETLLAQTHHDVELIIIDDCSTDDSLAVLREYDRPGVTLVARTTNGGWVTVFNQGLDLASGEYVLFANCDDTCRPELAATLVAALEAAPSAGVAFCRSQMIDQDDHVIGDDRATQTPAFRKRCETDTVIHGSEMLHHLLRGCVIPNTSAALFRRACFDRVGSFSHAYPICGDWEFYFRLSEHYDTAYVATPLNGFRQHAATIRKRTRARLTYDEYLRLLLSWGDRVGLTGAARRRARADAIRVWVAYLVGPQLGGLADAPHHLRVVWAHDPRALVHLPGAVVARTLALLRKVRRRA